MNYIQEIIERFGGQRAMATALGHKHSSTVQSWRDRGGFPKRSHQSILDAAEKAGFDVVASDLTASGEVAETPIRRLQASDRIGWICPVCNKGNAPGTARCGHCAAREAKAPLLGEGR